MPYNFLWWGIGGGVVVLGSAQLYGHTNFIFGLGQYTTIMQNMLGLRCAKLSSSWGYLVTNIVGHLLFKIQSRSSSVYKTIEVVLNSDQKLVPSWFKTY